MVCNLKYLKRIDNDLLVSNRCIGKLIIAILTFVSGFVIPVEQLVLLSGMSFITPCIASNHRLFISHLRMNNNKQHLFRSSKYHISPKTHWSFLKGGGTALPTNATNFHGGMNASVDPRTGASSFTMPVATTLYDMGEGRRDLVLVYSGGNSASGSDYLGLGSHWTFNVGTEHPSTSEVAGHKTTDIVTGDGHSFTMVNDRNAQGHIYWHPLRHKLGDVHITGKPEDWTVATASGIREHIEFGYEDWEEGRDGQRIWFYYDRHGPQDASRRLLYICSHPLSEDNINSDKNQCQKNGVWLTYEGSKVVIHGQQNIVLHMNEASGEKNVQSVDVPSLSDSSSGSVSGNSQVQFGYDDQGGWPWLLKSVTGFSGETKIFLYNSESDRNVLQPQGLPTGFNKLNIPVVTEQITKPSPINRNIIPDRKIWYQYSAGTSDPHNFTGYLSGVSAEPGKDNLFDRSDNYTYTVVQDNGLTSTKTTYNKYHLPLTIVQTEDLHHTLLAKNDSTYLPWKGTIFSKLPATYSFPTQTAKTLYTLTAKGQDATVSPAKTVQQKQYNDNGQVIWQKDAYGRQIFTQYCPPQGDIHCPKMDKNWPQVTLPEKVLELSAKQTPEDSYPFVTYAATDDPATTVEVEFNYKLIPVAEKYHTRISLYHHFLELQWAKLKKLLAGHRNLLTMFSQRRLIHSVGEDTSDLAGNWQVINKQVGTLPADAVASLKPGQPLPELTREQLSTATDYNYNLDQNSSAYGQLTQLRVTKYNQPENTDFRLNSDLARGEDPEKISLFKKRQRTVLLTDNDKPEQVVFNITHTIDNKNYTRTVDIQVASQQNVSDIKGVKNLLTASRMDTAKGGGLSLGKSSYSLISGMKISSEDTLKTLHASWLYDIWQRPVKEIITPASGGEPQAILWTYIIDSAEESVIKTLPDGSQLKTVYAGAGKDQKVLSAWHRYKDKADESLSDPLCWIEDSSFTYTDTGQMASKTIYHAANNNGEKIALKTTYGYDALNRPVWQKNPNGVITITVRNDPQMLLIRYQVATGTNSQGEKISPTIDVVQSNVLGKPVAHYIFALDPKILISGKSLYPQKLQTTLEGLEGQLQPVTALKVEQSYGLLPLSGENGLFRFINDAINARAWVSETTTQYDGNGRRIEQTQPNGAETHWQWQHGNLVATIAPDGSMIHDIFDVQGNKISRCIKPTNESVCHVSGKRGYDEEGNLAWESDEYGNKITYTYDADNRLLSRTTSATKTSKAHVFSYTYNSFAKTSAAVDGVVYSTYTYNPKTWQITDAEDTIGHLHYDYDKNTGRLIHITHSSPVSLNDITKIHYPTGVETIVYDRYGQIIRLTDLAGNSYTTIHDRFGRTLQSMMIPAGKTESVLLNTITYDPYFNRPVETVNGIGIVRRITYNDLGEVESTVDKRGNNILERFSYTYDLQTKNITTFTRTEGDQSVTQTYSYDKNTNSMTTMTCSVTGKLGTPSFLCPHDTDVSGSHLTEAPVIVSQHYTFDNWNNIKTVSEKLITSEGKHTSKMVSYTYADSTGDNYDPHRMLAFSVQWNDNISDYSETPATIIYDSSGRVIKDAEGNALHYNALGQQDSFINAKTGTQTQYLYDSSGHQVAELFFDAKGKALQQPLYMVYQGDTVVEQVQQDAKGTLHRSNEINNIAHSEDGVINRWYLHDYKGDVIATFNASGQRTSNHVYSPYGMDDDLLSHSIQTLPAKFTLATEPWWKSHSPGFDGQMNDPATGYQFLGGGYRAYNPVYRRFMSHDSYSPFKKIDGYGFGDNNPVMNTDPTGHLPKWLGYALGGLGMGMALLSAFMLPVVAGAAVSSSIASGVIASSTAAETVSGITAGATATMGVSGGSLQIASTAHPCNKNLMIASQAYGIADGITTMLTGGMTIASGVVQAFQNYGKIVVGMVITSGISDTLSGATEESSSDIGMAMSVNHNIAQKAGLANVVKIMGYVSVGLMSASILSNIGLVFNPMISVISSAFTPQLSGSNEVWQSILTREGMLTYSQPILRSYSDHGQNSGLDWVRMTNEFESLDRTSTSHAWPGKNNSVEDLYCAPRARSLVYLRNKGILDRIDIDSFLKNPEPFNLAKGLVRLRDQGLFDQWHETLMSNAKNPYDSARALVQLHAKKALTQETAEQVFNMEQPMLGIRNIINSQL